MSTHTQDLVGGSYTTTKINKVNSFGKQKGFQVGMQARCLIETRAVVDAETDASIFYFAGQLCDTVHSKELVATLCLYKSTEQVKMKIPNFPPSSSLKKTQSRCNIRYYLINILLILHMLEINIPGRGGHGPH